MVDSRHSDPGLAAALKRRLAPSLQTTPACLDAEALAAYVDGEMAPAERHAKIAVSKGRLVDLERIVLRDTSLKGRATPAVKKIFDNYDLAFLVHAATENNLTVMDHWLEQLGLTAQSLTIAQRRRR